MEIEKWSRGKSQEPWRIISREHYWALLKELATCTRLDFGIAIDQELPGTPAFPLFEQACLLQLYSFCLNIVNQVWGEQITFPFSSQIIIMKTTNLGNCTQGTPPVGGFDLDNEILDFKAMPHWNETSGISGKENILFLCEGNK